MVDEISEERPGAEIKEPKAGSRTALIAWVFLGAILGGIIASFLVPYLFGINPVKLFRGEFKISERQIVVTEKVTPEALEKMHAGDPVVSVARKVKPAVVFIRTQEVVSNLFHEGLRATGEGSGVIYKSDGYILTNEHVVRDAREITVVLASGEDLKGKIIGSDLETDLAVIKVDKTGLPVASLGSTRNVEVGELAVAIGAPFGFEFTVTSGVISALNRNVSDSESGRTYTDLIQTDAAINPGNSGGALTNGLGQVIGINSLIISTVGGSQGVGFAIPIDLARSIADQLIAEGKASHPYIGILGQTVDEDVAQRFGLAVQKGAMITDVVEPSPASKAGLAQGDIIIEFDGTKINSMEELIAAIRSKRVGDKVRVVYLRGKERRTAELTLEEKPQRLQ
jgi:S1-C subfamily serine protease